MNSNTTKIVTAPNSGSHLQSRIMQVGKTVLEPLNFFLISVGLVPLLVVFVYIRLRAQNVVFGDESNTLRMMAAIRTGTFNLSYIFERVLQSHHVYFTMAKAALLIWLTDYNLSLGVSLDLLLACVCLGFLLYLFHDSEPRLTRVAFPVFSLLMFSVHQDLNWLLNWHGLWFFEILFICSAIWLLVHYRRQWRGIGLGALLTFCATFEAGSGLFIWPVVAIILWPLGYRRKRFIVFWGITAAATIWLWRITSPALSDGLLANLTTLSGVLTEICFTFTWLGAYFVSRIDARPYLDPYSLALGVGLLGTGILIFNAIYLWRTNKDRVALWGWLALASVSILAGASIGLGLHFEANQSIKEAFSNRPFISWYATIQNLFWIPFAALAILVIWQASAGQTLYKKLPALGNITVLVGLLICFIFQSQRVETTSYVGPLLDQQISGTPQTETCAKNYVFTMDATCLAEYQSIVDVTAAYKVTVFAQLEPKWILPESYQPGQPILVETRSAWTSVHMRDWLLSGADESNLFFVYSLEAPVDSHLPPMPHPVVNKTTRPEADLPKLLDFVARSKTFWFIRQDAQTTDLEGFWEEVSKAGYRPAETTTYEPGGFLITAYHSDVSP